MWRWLGRKGPSGFSSSSTAEEVTEGIDGTGLTAVITGASSGIGKETARVLALRGVHVVMGVRNLSAGNSVKEEIVKEIPGAKIDTLELDLASMASVRKFSTEFRSLNLPLNILINNAGIWACPFSLSSDGIEIQFATNHVGHFLLTDLLLENMKNAAKNSNIEGRIVNLSSGYNNILAYGQSKLANILHANELSRRFKDEGINITANSVHPGAVLTKIFRYHSIINAICYSLGQLVMKNVQQGAATTCYVALHPQVHGVNGSYFCDCNISKPSSKAEDQELGKKLWSSLRPLSALEVALRALFLQ
ncbi:unnamed protein product [Spirodela intermedia]|uniref:Uncharacterized protein n=1 Tax=Spirodela intermedia TaxID=51605 RepID=A0A7I8IXC6_SPIIN|nr:unnamed protein product [Spirodela intermedia]CAA6662644.1 unnamed protein product [Spirodela intermedia]